MITIINRVKKSGILFFICMLHLHLFAQTGKDGAKTISTTGVIFNRYDVLASSASTGATTITVTAIANLSAAAIAGANNNPYNTGALSFGDLIMIIKMQGAAINTTNTAAYGGITAYNNVGQYELQIVKGITGNVITLCSALTNTYNVSSTERVQIVRIPRLSALTINAASSLTAPVWGASFTGGIVAIEVTGNTIINGSVTADGIGFRGGVIDNTTTGPPGTSNFVSPLPADGGEKGESIAGFQTDYDALNGRYDRGAPANGGGGGVSHNSSGGGGANGGNPASWNGLGNPDNSGTNYSAAWDLEGSSFHSNTSTGGGRGGYSFGGNSVSPITTAPGDASWGGDSRRNIGGYGGRPLTYSTSTLFFGGGGGAGDANNNATQDGGKGGGIIYLLVTGTLSGSGTLTANGAVAGNTINGNNDAPGGGGGGGAIKLNVQGTISGITVNANGGAGGNQGPISGESEGPGGGGGGGYVSVTGSPSITITVNGGSNGTSASTSLTLFTPNGATSGGTGTSSTGNSFVGAPAPVCFALPLTLLSYNAKMDASGMVNVTWATDIENNIKRFEVQISYNGTDWQTIGTAIPFNDGNAHSYSLNAGTISQRSLFRLKITEQDYSYSYSAVKSLNPGTKVTVYVNGNILNIEGLPKNADEVRICNTLGMVSIKKTITSLQNVMINISSLPSGVYFVMWNNSTSTGRIKFLKIE